MKGRWILPATLAEVFGDFEACSYPVSFQMKEIVFELYKLLIV